MKKRKIGFFLVVLTGVLLTGCKKENLDTPEQFAAKYCQEMLKVHYPKLKGKVTIEPVGVELWELPSWEQINGKGKITAQPGVQLYKLVSEDPQFFYSAAREDLSKMIVYQKADTAEFLINIYRWKNKDGWGLVNPFSSQPKTIPWNKIELPNDMLVTQDHLEALKKKKGVTQSIELGTPEGDKIWTELKKKHKLD